MGYGDYLMLSGQVRELKTMFPEVQVGCPEGERTGFFKEIFKGNPYVSSNNNFQKNEPFIHLPRVGVGVRDEQRNKIVWKKDFQAVRGDLFLDHGELKFGRRSVKKINPDKKRVVVIEPFSKTHQGFSDGSIKKYNHHVNREWITFRYAELIESMPECVFVRPVANRNSRKFLDSVIDIESNFREACSLIAAADLYIGCEGGFAHAAGALGKKAVVIFGGWISPITTGYAFHENLFVGSPQSACGNLRVCPHCEASMQTISVSDVRQRLVLALKK